MQIVRHLDAPGWNLPTSIVTLGNFDGLHLGHRALIAGAVGDAKKIGALSVVLTFEPHPLKVLAPDRAPKLILAHKDKLEMFRIMGVDVVAVQPFDISFARIEAEDFVRDLLVARLNTQKIWIGKDFRFGRGRRGGVKDLVRWGGEHGFEVAVVEPVLVNSDRVSSSRIRELLASGRVSETKAMLGRFHFISGRVVEGQRRGKDLGFPTANVASRTELLPADGIYATLFHRGARTHLSVASVGLNPTFGAGPRTIESFIMNFDENIYGEEVRLSFVERLRAEAKFSSVEGLVAQIRQDVANAEAIFRAIKIHPGVSRPYE